MKVVFRDTAEEIPMPRSAREVLPFLRVLWLWEVNFFWYLALSFEMMLLFFLGEKFPALGRNKLFLQRVISLLACCKCLTDEMDCDVYFDSEAVYFKRMSRGFWKRVGWGRDFIWGWALMGEGYMWYYLGERIGNAKLKDLIFYRAVKVGETGANRLTNGEAFPGIKTQGGARSGTHGTGQNLEGK